MMNASNRLQSSAAIIEATVPLYLRVPHRISISLSWNTYQMLLERSDVEGRSLSNLAAHLLERALRP
jgi:hypothetical protein